MKIGVLLEEKNFRRYASLDNLPKDYELFLFGNRDIDEDAVAASKAEMLIVDPMVPVKASLIQKMPTLKLIQSQGVGYNLFDTAAARAQGVDVANCAGANATAVAEQAVLLMLSVLRGVKETDRMVYAARQAEAKGRCFQNGITELRDCHVGIVGMGAIGMATAKLLGAFGCKVSYWNRKPKPDCDLPYLSKEELLRQCDIVSLHVAVTPETTNFINDETLAMMKPGSILINTARGEIVDQEALCRAIVSGHLGGAGLDTLSPEPVTTENPLLHLPEECRDRVVLSPHIGGITEGSFRRYFGIIWENAAHIVAGEAPRNIVN